MKLPILIAIPHGKTDLPKEVKERVLLSAEEIQERYCDYGSDELFTGKLWHTVSAPYSRLFCDLNRPHDDWEHSANLKKAGIVRQQTEDGRKIYDPPLSEKEKKGRTEGHKNFYTRCLQVIETEEIRFFIAGHTMEDYPYDTKPTPDKKRPDVVISTNNYQTCDEPTAYYLAAAFRAQGFTVQIDDPFLGGHLLTHFCDKEKLPGVQIEMRRGLFSYGPHEISDTKLQDTQARIQKAILAFWHAYSSRKELATERKS